MKEITNKLRGPVSLMVRSRRGPTPQEFTILNIPGVGKGMNKVLLEDERMTDHVYRCEDHKLIYIRSVDDESLPKGVI